MNIDDPTSSLSLRYETLSLLCTTLGSTNCELLTWTTGACHAHKIPQSPPSMLALLGYADFDSSIGSRWPFDRGLERLDREWWLE
jgi:hypothetical protein